MNTLDSISEGIKVFQQDTAKKQDSYLDDVSIFDFSNALQFANQSHNFSYDAIQNNSNDIVSQNAVSASPYKPTATSQDNSYQKSLDNAVSKYNLNKNTTNNEADSSAHSTYETSNEVEHTSSKIEHKETQAVSKEEVSTKEIKQEEAKSTNESAKKEVKAEGESEASKAETKAQKVQGEAQKVQVDGKLLDEMDTEVSVEDTKKAKEILKAQELEVSKDVEEENVNVKTQDKEVKLEAKVETNVKAQEKVQSEEKAVKTETPVATKLKEDIEAKFEEDVDVDLEQNIEVEASVESEMQGDEGMLFGQKQNQNSENGFASKNSKLPSEVALSSASKRAAFNRVFSAAQPKSLEESNILNQVLRKVSEKLAQNNPKISISLTPDKLGKIDVDFIQGKNGVTAQITAESSQVKEALAKNLNTLRDSLASQGVSVSNINIKVEKTEESNNANLDMNNNKNFDMGQQGEQAGNSDFAQEGNKGENVAFSSNADIQEGLDENTEAKADDKPSSKHEHSTVEYQA